MVKGAEHWKKFEKTSLEYSFKGFGIKGIYISAGFQIINPMYIFQQMVKRQDCIVCHIMQFCLNIWFPFQ